MNLDFIVIILGIAGFLVAQLLLNIVWLVKLTTHVNKEIAGSNERMARLETEMRHVLEYIERSK